MQAKYRVDIIESEKGWGQKLDFQKDFNSYEEAEVYVKDFNSRNTDAKVPDWYMYATKPYLVDLELAGAPKK